MQSGADKVSCNKTAPKLWNRKAPSLLSSELEEIFLSRLAELASWQVEKAEGFDHDGRKEVLTINVCISPNFTWLVTSRLDTTQHVRRVERVETSVSSRAVRQLSSTHPKCMGSTRRTCRVNTWRAEWNFGFPFPLCEAASSAAASASRADPVS